MASNKYPASANDATDAYEQYVLSLEEMHDLPTNTRFARLMHAALGIAGESGEFADSLKKHLVYGKNLDIQNLIEELGDILWYIVVAADALGTTLSGLMETNRQKLERRFPKGQFSPEQALARADKEKE
jgi:NTP pyrophosphatase (non-canonical NTP hydrolase)